MTSLKLALDNALEYLSKRNIDIPHDILVAAASRLKTAAGYDMIQRVYRDTMTNALIGYFEGGSIVAARNAFKKAMVEAFGAAFDAAWMEAGGILPPSAEALAWFNARVNAELGYIDLLFQQAKELRGMEDFDYFTWITQRADGYLQTLRGIYNNGKARAMKGSLMVTFLGDDGKESCDTCQWLKGQRHRLSWFIGYDYIPPFGGGLDCAKGGRCKHYLEADDGYRVTE